MKFDTIAAISTPIGTAGLSVIRVTGEGSIEAINSIFKGKDLTKAKGNTIHYGHILDKDGSVVDEVMISVFRAPKSFTKEDTIEDRKSTRLNSSHVKISYAVFCLKKK